MRRADIFVALAWLASSAWAQDAREIVRKSVELDQSNWMRMRDYTWIARETERHLDSNGRVKSVTGEVWETLVLSGKPYRRILERDGQPLSPEEERKEKEKLDKAVAKLDRESPEEKRHRLDELDKQRRKDREFLREIPELYDFHLEGDAKIDGRDVWVISGTPKPDYHPRLSDAKALLKIKGKIWIDKSEYQWVRLEAQTTATISFGWILARLNPGAKLYFEQTRVNDELWLPKLERTSGSGRLGLLKKLALDQELTWSNYRKFQVESRVVPSN